MNGLQKTFLLYTFIYFLIKGALFVGLYVALVAVEKDARARFAKLRVYLQAKRQGEVERWTTAYRLLGKQVENEKIHIEPQVATQTQVVINEEPAPNPVTFHHQPAAA